MTSSEIFDILNELFPDAHCELDHRNSYEMTVAVVLSAQTTDVKVNAVTGKLFEKYPDVQTLAKADVDDVIDIIKTLGLYKNKAQNIIRLSKEIIERFGGEIPDSMEELTSLSGVGRKSANVILSECFNVPAIAVDTHVERVSKRLNLALKDDSVMEVEMKLQKAFKKEQWSRLHHLLIFFGRYKCKAVKPLCEDCPFADFCRK